MGKYFYQTDFSLVRPVNDFDKAYDYLKDDDMAHYLKSSIDYEKDKCEDFGLYSDDILSVEWELEDADSGVINVVTRNELSPQASEYISDWIHGQCSDGLGEGFEQQPFAEFYDEDEWGDPDPDTYEMASFDWETNKYPLHLTHASESRETACNTHLTESGEKHLVSMFDLILEHSGDLQKVRKLMENANPTQSNPLKVDCPRGQYYLWQDADGTVWGSTEKPDKFISNARAIKNFTDSGFESLDDAIAYVKKYF